MPFEEIEAGILGEFPYSIRKHPRFETLNGYLGIPKGHPWYQVDHNHIDTSVHGGLTYAAHHSSNQIEGLDPTLDIWWIGFDCGHAWDIIPGIEKLEKELGFEPIRIEGSSYKDRDYVFNELEELAQQATVAMQVGEILNGAEKES